MVVGSSPTLRGQNLILVPVLFLIDERMATLPVGVPLEDLAYFLRAKNNASSLIASS